MTRRSLLRPRTTTPFIAAVLLLGLAWAGHVAWQAYRGELAGFKPQPHAPRLSLTDFHVDGLQRVVFKSQTGTNLVGYYAPSKNGAAIVLCHGSLGERSDLVDEVRILAGAGFGALAFDWPGHGESEGAIQWGEPERLALAGALDFLTKQTGVDPRRLGAFGFSMGGYIVTQVAASDTRIAATALASSPHDPVEHTRWEYRKWAFLRQTPALLALKISGMRVDEQVPVRVIGRIAPRPVLLIRGSNDQVVPSWITTRLYDAAGSPKQELVVPGAGHGGFAAADPEGYPRALLRFFELLNGEAATSGAEKRAP
jgi:alpha-beta hydrolase superfamily lysophospholipase